MAIFLSVLGVDFTQGAPRNPIDRAERLRRDANWLEAWDLYQKIAFSPSADTESLIRSISQGADCLDRLGRTDQLDKFLDQTVASHPNDWRVLWRAANVIINAPHFGYTIGGQFRRGPHRGGGEMVSSFSRDRVCALQWMALARPMATGDPNRSNAGAFFIDFAEMIRRGRTGQQSWRLQELTDLSSLPDFDPGYTGDFSQGPDSFAPVASDGKPVTYSVPDDFSAAKSDGQRFRYCLMRAGQVDPKRRPEADLTWADFVETNLASRRCCMMPVIFDHSNATTIRLEISV